MLFLAVMNNASQRYGVAQGAARRLLVGESSFYVVFFLFKLDATAICVSSPRSDAHLGMEYSVGFSRLHAFLGTLRFRVIVAAGSCSFITTDNLRTSPKPTEAPQWSLH